MPVALLEKDEQEAWLQAAPVKPRFDFSTFPELYKQQSLF
jgi:hypothetical protein